MSLFSNLLKGVGKVAAGFITGGPVGAVGGLISAVGGAQSASKAPLPDMAAFQTSLGGVVPQSGLASYSVGGGPSIPAPLQVSAINLPALNATQQAVTSAGAGGLPVPWFKGPGGKLQMPWNDPRIPEYLKQFALDDAYLRAYYRAPKGYVIVKDASGRPFAVAKVIAKQFGLWKPSAKPPISATDYKHFKRNKAIERKLKKIAGPIIRKHSSRSSAACSTRSRKK